MQNITYFLIRMKSWHFETLFFQVLKFDLLIIKGVYQSLCKITWKKDLYITKNKIKSSKNSKWNQLLSQYIKLFLSKWIETIDFWKRTKNIHWYSVSKWEKRVLNTLNTTGAVACFLIVEKLYTKQAQ